jgi:hypothetical protein
MTLATALTAYRLSHIDLSLTASDLCQRMPPHLCAPARPTPLNDLRSTREPRLPSHIGLPRNRPVQPRPAAAHRPPVRL